jgi:hypothetical protein
MRRANVNKMRGARKFRSASNRTNVMNVRAKPQRGGWRL